jgi:RNA polymerase sigma-70 factor (ECF subfamily)
MFVWSNRPGLGIAGGVDHEFIAAVSAGDEPAFTALVERHRQELHVHCYRMLGSLEEAEDRVQETFLRAWRRRTGFEGRSSLRVWLYRIATNACLETLRRRPRSVVEPADAGGRPRYSAIPWLEPYPDRLLDQATSGEEEPDSVVISKETIELAFLAVIQLLPPRQRAVLLLRDMLAFSAAETASLLEASVPAVNSALQRARETMRQRRPPGRPGRPVPASPSSDERALLRRYMDAHEHGDPAAVIALLREDARLTIVPAGMSWDGRDAIASTLHENMTASGEFRCQATRANRQPAVAIYLRRWREDQFQAFSLVVFGIEDRTVTEMTTFLRPGLFPAFGLPPVM